MLKMAAAGLALPAILPACAALPKKRRSNDTMRLGVIGVGRQGRGDMGHILRVGLEPEIDARVVAIADVDSNRAALGRVMVEEFYAGQRPDEPRARVATFSDYRDLLARSDIDGVLICTPDHWHAFNGIDAAAARKDIYIQKPITYSIEEGKALVKAVRRNRVILQTGSQQRSDATFRRACQIVRNGRLGKLESIHVGLPADSGTGNPEPMPVPVNLDYDRWLGPAEYAPYTEHRVHPQEGFGRPGYLQVERHCLGMITGWGSHMFDTAQWGNGTDESGLAEIQATAEFPDRGLFNVHTNFEAEGVYANGVKLTASTGPAGVRFNGEKGWLFVGRGVLEASDPQLIEEGSEEGPVQLYVSDNHYRNFLECMRTRKDPICPVEVGHRSNTVCGTIHIAMKLGRRLHWDHRAERFIDDDEANSMLSAPYRAGWSV